MGVNVAGVELETVEHDWESGTVRTLFDQEKTSPSMAVIAALADVMDVDPDELEKLHSTIDPDALDSLVRVRARTSGDTCVTFTHENHSITVHSYGVVSIVPGCNPAAEVHRDETGR